MLRGLIPNGTSYNHPLGNELGLLSSFREDSSRQGSALRAVQAPRGVPGSSRASWSPRARLRGVPDRSFRTSFFPPLLFRCLPAPWAPSRGPKTPQIGVFSGFPGEPPFWAKIPEISRNFAIFGAENASFGRPSNGTSVAYGGSRGYAWSRPFGGRHRLGAPPPRRGNLGPPSGAPKRGFFGPPCRT